MVTATAAIPNTAAEPRTLRLLHLEDSLPDHELAMAQLRRAGLRVQALRVESRTEFVQALAQGGWDMVLSDFNLPGFDGLQAQQILKDSAPELPFVLVSGQIGEDAAVEAMRNGASDYLLKDKLTRLAPAVEHAIAAADERRARLASDRALGESRQRLSELAQHLQLSIELERAAIAREIHDEVGGSLTALNFDLSWIGRHVESPAVRQRVASALETVAHAVESSQRIMHNLRPAILEQGLVPALQWLSSRFEKRNGVVCRFRSRHESMALPSGVPLVAYRFAQEALTNVSKHANATQVTIDLSLTRGVLSLEVVDNGCGLKADDLDKARSFGLRGLRERASTVGGWVEVSGGGSDARAGMRSGTGGPTGTTLLLSVPVGQGSGVAAEARYDADADHDPSAWGAL